MAGRIHLFLACALFSAPLALKAQTQVTLSPTTSPAAGEPGVTTITLTGSGFPSGVIAPNAVALNFKPVSSGTIAVGVATGVTTIAGSTRRITFTIPSSINVSAPSAYKVSITGSTTAGTAFDSSNTAALTVNPVASLISVTPNTGTEGQSLTLSIVGSYTNFLQGATQVSFAAGVTVNSLTVSDSTHLTANITIQNNAPTGPQAITVKTGIEQASLPSGFTVQGIPVITQVNPSQGQQGQQNLSVTVLAQYTHFAQGVTTASFGAGVTVASLTVNSATSATAVLNINSGAAVGVRDVTITTSLETVTATGSFTIQPGTPAITQINPSQALQGQQSLSVTVTGQYTHFAQGATTASFGAGITVAALTINSQVSATALLNIDPAATVGVRDVTLTTNAEVARLTGGFTVQPGTPVLLSSSPNFGQQGQQNVPVAITGQYTHFGSSSTVVLGGGITASNVVATDSSHLSAQFAIPTNAPNYASTVVADQPVAYYRLDEPSAAVVAVDSSGTGNDGAYNGTPTLGVPGLILGPDTAATLNGTGTVAVPDSPSLDFVNQPFSIEVWASGVPLNGTAARVFDKLQAGTTNGYALELSSNGIRFVGSASLVVATPLSTSATYHVVAVSDGAGNGSIYVDGVLAGSGPFAAGQPYKGPALIGSASDGTEAWLGTVDEVALYNVALSAQRVLAHYQAGSTAQSLTVTTGAETVTLTNAFSVIPAPILESLSPSTGQQGQSNLSLTLRGQFTHFAQGPTTANFGPGITVASLNVNNSAIVTAVVNIDPAATSGTNPVSLSTNTETVPFANGFTIAPGSPVLFSAMPNAGQQGQGGLSVALIGQYTHWTQGITTANFGLGVTVASLVVSSATSATAVLNIDPAANIGQQTITVTTGAETVTIANGFKILPGTLILLSTSPNQGQQGQQNLQVTLVGQYTHFTQGTTSANFGAGTTVSSLTVISLTSASVVLSIDPAAAIGAQNVTLTTGTEIVTLTNGFSIQPGTPSVTQVTPNQGQQGQQNLSVVITGQYTHFVQGTTTANFGSGVTVLSLTVNSATSATAVLNIDPAASTGVRNVVVTTSSEIATLTNGFTVQPGTPIITQVSPSQGQQGQNNLAITITGQYTHFAQGTTTASLGTGVTVSSLTVNVATSATLVLNIDPATATGPRDVTFTTGTEVVVLTGGYTVTAGGPYITGFSPISAPAGTLISVNGLRFVPTVGVVPQLALNKQGGGTLSAVLSSFTNTSLSFVIPAGAATGPLTITAGGQSGTSAASLTITPSSTFTLTAIPSSANLIQGQSVSYAIQMISAGAFNELAQLSVTGVPAGVTAAFKPASIATGQTATLTLTAPINQALGPSSLSVMASTTVDGLSVTQTAGASVSVLAPTTAFVGRTVVANSAETPLAGVTVSMLGKDGAGGTTGCSGSATSDSAGNFALTGLPSACVGPQLVGFDGTTASTPPGKYAGVNLLYTFTAGSVTASPVLVHLPRIDTVETFMVQQNSGSNQSYSYTSIPGLSLTVYAHTTFTLPDGTQPNPFPLAAVQVPVDRLPDLKPPVPTMLNVFIVAFQPANVTTNQPVAVSYPNIINTAPGTDMALLTLDPTLGKMVPYGTGAVSANGTQVVPDADPGHPGHLYGIVHFDWHGAMPPGPPTVNPPPTCQCTPGSACVCPLHIGNHSVDVSSGLDVLKYTDISVHGPRGSITIERTLRTLSPTPGPFGIGSGLNYSYQLGTFSFIAGAGIINLVMPDGNQFPFALQLDGTLINTTVPTLRGAVMTVPSSGVYNITWNDGSVYQFQSPPSSGRIAYLTSITDTNGNATTISLNPSIAGQIIQVTDPAGRSLNLSYDSSSRITSITDPIARTVQYTYTTSGYLATVTDPIGGVTTYTYDSLNRLVSVQNPRGILTEQNTFDSAGRIIQQIEADGGINKFAYTLVNPLAPTSPVLSAVVTDPNTNSAAYRFTPNQLLTDATDSAGQTRTFALDPTHSSLITGVSGTGTCPVCGDSSSGDHAFTLDAVGNVLTNTDQLGNTTTYTYGPAFNKVTSIADPTGSKTKLSYDSRGNVLTRMDPNGNTTTFVYNSFGQIAQIIDPVGQKSLYSYDTFGNLVTVTDAQGNVTTTIYDAISRPVQTIDALGRRTQTTYDALGRVVSQTNAQGNKTIFGFDAVGNLLSVTDMRGNKTSFTYDGVDRLLTRTTALGTSDFRTYDANGNLASFTDRRGQKSSYAYDSLNRLVTETYADSTVTRSYDANSRLVEVNDSLAGQFAFTYDTVGRLTSSKTPIGQVQYAYDSAGRVTSRQVSGQAAVVYSYDPAANLVSASTSLAAVTQSLDARNLVTAVSRSNGVSSLYGYDSLERTLSIASRGPTGPLTSQTYAYDAVGNRVTSTSNNAQSLITPAVGSAAYDPNNEQALFGTTSNSFDANGNLVSSTTPSGTTTYTWDSRNRLASIVSPTGQTTKLIYDFAGNLIQQTDIGVSGTLMQSFVLDDLTNVAYVNRSDGDQYNVLSGRSIDQHLAAVHLSGQVEYSLTDAINSTVATVDQTGAIKGQFEYEPFGQTTSTGSTYPFQYTGRVWVSGRLYYYRARFYSPTMGRFISEDPSDVTFASNAFEYVLNRPANVSDPTGLSTCTYYVSAHRLQCWSSNNGLYFDSSRVTSGNGDCADNPDCDNLPNTGPIPSGTYAIGLVGLTPTPHGKPRVSLTRIGGGTSRSGFQFHPRGRSDGCIAIDPGDYPNFINVLSSNNHGGTLVVYP